MLRGVLFLPIGDTPNDHLRRPILTWTLIGVNLLATGVMSAHAHARGMSLEEFVAAAGHGGYVPGQGDLASVFTHMFVHANWLHVLGNMLFLWIFGDNVESRLGHLGFLAAYLGTGVAALFAHVAIAGEPGLALVGASGAVSGVQGLYFVACPGARVRLFVWLLFFVRVVHVPARLIMLVWFALQDGLPLLVAEGLPKDTVAHWAHLGGFGAGLLLMALLVPLLGRGEPPPRRSIAERYPHRSHLHR
jgi:membrane associated rhomboid family serine protease